MSSSTRSKNNNPKKLLNIKFFWKKKERPSNDSSILINGKLLVFIACSIISGFINLVFITNLTKSAYTIGTLLSVPAAVLLGLMSIGLDLSKCLHSIQVNTLNELYRKLSNRPWASKIKSVSRKWFTIYILYVILSIITSMSLSTISIGAGITRNANTLKQIDGYIAKGELYTDIDTKAKNAQMQNLIDQAQDSTESDAVKFTQEQVAAAWPIIEEWQNEYRDFVAEGLSTDDTEELEEPYNGSKTYFDYWKKRNNQVRTALHSAGYSGDESEWAISKLRKANFEANIKNNYMKTYKVTSNNIATEKLGHLTDSTMAEATGWLETLNSVQLINPRTGDIVVFDTNPEKPTKVLVTTALERLKALRVDIENDSGDIGSSSKIFMQMGSLFNESDENTNTDLNEALNKKSKGSFGTTEILMMGMLLFLSLLCELAINQFSPKTAISRKMLSQFSQYFPAGFDVNDFMLEVLIEQYNYGEITKDRFDKEVKETLAMMKVSKQSLLGALDIMEDPLAGLKKSLEKKAIKAKVVVKDTPANKENTISAENAIKKEPISTESVIVGKPIVRATKKDEVNVDKLEQLDKALSAFEIDLGDN